MEFHCDSYGTEIQHGDIYYEFWNHCKVSEHNISSLLRDALRTSEDTKEDTLGTIIRKDEDYYELFGDIVAENNIHEYLKEIEKYASND